jgi:hypothetical protein
MRLPSHWHVFDAMEASRPHLHVKAQKLAGVSPKSVVFSADPCQTVTDRAQLRQLCAWIFIFYDRCEHEVFHVVWQRHELFHCIAARVRVQGQEWEAHVCSSDIRGQSATYAVCYSADHPAAGQPTGTSRA